MIDYSVIAHAIRYYEANGFLRVEVPWTVTEEVLNITKPEGAKHNYQLRHDNGKCLVASAEQSFLYQYLKGFLPKGRFQATTPCFRFENYDELHTKNFIKTELIITDKVDTEELKKVIGQTFNFFRNYFPVDGLSVEPTGIVGGEKTYDITFNGDELGSYGIRECSFLKWIYATGVAEPRLSMIRRKYGLSQN